ncbi:type II toxin-antitoxin system RelE/ParE family toxin [Mucilaginibacter sp.]|uniref:type II toxin-antitoxin system RelE/ParE family toxin n=1 Tax=Mucilaginibacter sp. TaxID=1882438 RepID=UPI00283E33E1|nr:type II toxin-antitoxin system RelE/ParE family toxin [Mucilaginibacter sp.]MDR3695526.1 type II toxin-antitoxin system RelE/ParE family toxin [Mucilaginibacter sp.]
MNYTVDLLFKARQEIFDGWKWYEKEPKGLGDRFEDEVFRKIALIAANPLHYPLKKGAREAVTETFPYLIIYKINESRKLIMILSVFHTSRHPKKKR